MEKENSRMKWIKTNALGILVCAVIAAVAWQFGEWVPVVGSPVFAILLGMIAALFLKGKESLRAGVSFTSKKVLQYAVIRWDLV